MSAFAWSMSPHTVHVNEDPTAAIARAERGGALVFRWSLQGVRNITELGLSAEKVFQPPYRSPSIDGMIDYASDLEWFETPQGVLFVVDAAGARAKVVLMAARSMLPVGDRWRGQGKPFEAFVTGVDDVGAVLEALERENAHLDEFGRKHPDRDTHRLPVVVGEHPVLVNAPRRHHMLRWSRRGA